MRVRSAFSIFLALLLVTQTSAIANERMLDPRATPNSSTYDIYEFKLKQKSIFDGQKYVPGAETIQLAVPKTVQCSRSAAGTSCTAFIRASGGSPATLNPGRPGYTAPLYFSLYQAGTAIANINVGTEALKSAGAIWVDNQVTFKSEAGGPLTFQVVELPWDPAVFSFTIQTIVQSKADFDAQEAAKEAARQAAEKEAAKAEAARTARILATKLTITCTSGGRSKKVVGDPPVCPKGYVNPVQKHATFQAYSKCKLYKKQFGIGARAALQDGGKTLFIEGFGLEYDIIDLNRQDWACVVKTLKIPSSVTNRIGQTRAIDGVVSAKFAGLEAFWTYHPDDGLDITFSR